MKKIMPVLVAVFCCMCLFPDFATLSISAEELQVAEEAVGLEVTVYLKSGEIIKGKFVEKTPEELIIEKSGNQLSFSLSNVVRIAEATTDKNLPAKYTLPFSTAIITYELKGMQKGNETVYIDAVNNRLAIETSAVTGFAGFSQAQNTLQICDGEKIYHININADKKEGHYLEKEADNIMDVFMERFYIGRPVKHESFLGKDCIVYQLPEGNVYFWNGILLKHEITMDDPTFSIAKEAKEIKLDVPIPAGKMQIPEGITMKTWDEFIAEAQELGKKHQEKFTQTFKEELLERAKTDPQAKKMLEAVTGEDGSLDMEKYYQLMQEDADKMLMEEVKAMPEGEELIKKATAEDGTLDLHKLRSLMYEAQREKYAAETAERQKKNLLRKAATSPKYKEILQEATAEDGTLDIKKAQLLMQQQEEKELLEKVKKLEDGQALIEQATNSLGVVDMHRLRSLFWKKQSALEERTRVLTEAARVYREQEQYDQALRKYNEAIELNPLSTYAYIERSRLFERMGEDKKAIDDLNTIIEIQPYDNAYHLYQRGEIYDRLEKYSQAIADYTQALAIENQHMQQTLERRREALRQAGESEEQIIPEKISSMGIRILLDRGKAYRKIGESQKALEDFSRVIEVNPHKRTLGDAYFLRGLVYRDTKENKKMQADWQQAKSLGDKLVIGECVQGKKQGLYVWYYPEGGVLSQATYADNKFEGEFVRFHPNGQISQKGIYKAGKLVGLYTCYAPNGRKSKEGNYKNGLREGAFISYDASTGAVIKKMNYARGKLEGECVSMYWDNGQPLDKGSFKNGVRHGISYRYYENGQIQQQVPFENGLEDGTAILYNQDGSFKKRVFFNNGQRTGQSLEP